MSIKDVRFIISQKYNKFISLLNVNAMIEIIKNITESFILPLLLFATNIPMKIPITPSIAEENIIKSRFTIFSFLFYPPFLYD